MMADEWAVFQGEGGMSAGTANPTLAQRARRSSGLATNDEHIDRLLLDLADEIDRLQAEVDALKAERRAAYERARDARSPFEPQWIASDAMISGDIE